MMSQLPVVIDSIAEPLRLAPALAPKPWGGRRLEQFGKTLPEQSIGESLESGSDAVIVGGRFDGLTLGELAQCAPDALLGSLGRAESCRGGDFPLLVKLLDARDTLSIQVHPDDASAPAGKRGKTEAWLILDAAPGAQIIAGVNGPLDLDRIEEQLVVEPVQPGDVFLLPAGTVHAIGAGVVLYEIQQASDVTYRLYDWGSARDVHVSEALEVVRSEQRVRRVKSLRLDAARELLVACRHFALERWTVEGATTLPRRPASCRVLTVIDGELTLDGERWRCGESAAMPADLPECALGGVGVALLGYVPDLELDIVQPLRAAGFANDEITAIGTDVQ